MKTETIREVVRILSFNEREETNNNNNNNNNNNKIRSA
jgi:hypothetical protein